MPVINQIEFSDNFRNRHLAQNHGDGVHVATARCNAGEVMANAFTIILSTEQALGQSILNRVQARGDIMATDVEVLMEDLALLSCQCGNNGADAQCIALPMGTPITLRGTRNNGTLRIVHLQSA